MVVDDLDVFGSGGGPTEADTVLVVDPDAVLALPVTPERFQTIPRRHPQVIKLTSDLKLPEFAARHLFEGEIALYAPASDEGLCVGVTERDDHVRILTPHMHNVKRDYKKVRTREADVGLVPTLLRLSGGPMPLGLILPDAARCAG